MYPELNTVSAEPTAAVFNIQHYCIHDGPGIRTTVFLKGCPLDCPWCQNPESKSPAPQLLFYPHLCTGCGTCLGTCPVGAITRGDGGLARTDLSLCTACGECVQACPHSARGISGRCMTVSEVLEDVLADSAFYRHSGGGVTVSGGEPLYNPQFTEALLHRCREAGLHTALESSSFASREVVSAVFRWVDLGLLDIKIFDSAQHRKIIGQPNGQILNNIRFIRRELHVPVVIRVPVIPTYTDSVENLRQIAAFIAEELGRDTPVNLLPYHSMGLGKLESLGCPVPEALPVPAAEEMETYRLLFAECGLEATVGG